MLGKALAEGGTSFDYQYVNVNGASGYFSQSLNAYGQTGLPCPRCGRPIVRESFMNRGSHFCAHCQRVRAGSRRHASTRLGETRCEGVLDAVVVADMDLATERAASDPAAAHPDEAGTSGSASFARFLAGDFPAPSSWPMPRCRGRRPRGARARARARAGSRPPASRRAGPRHPGAPRSPTSMHPGTDRPATSSGTCSPRRRWPAPGSTSRPSSSSAPPDVAADFPHAYRAIMAIMRVRAAGVPRADHRCAGELLAAIAAGRDRAAARCWSPAPRPWCAATRPSAPRCARSPTGSSRRSPIPRDYLTSRVLPARGVRPRRGRRRAALGPVRAARRRRLRPLGVHRSSTAGSRSSCSSPPRRSRATSMPPSRG